MTAVLRSLLRRLTGPLGRRLFFVLLVAGAWFRWAYLPPRPLIAWDRPTDRLIDHAIFAPDGMTFLTVEKLRSDAVCDSTTLWHLPSGRRIVALTDVTQAWPCPCFAPDGSWVAALDWRGVISLRDTVVGKVRCELERPLDRHGVRSFGWRPFTVSPNGRHIASSPEQPEPPVVHLHDTTTGRLTVTPEGAAEPIAFSADGRMLATALFRDDDGAAIVLWDLDTGRALQRIGDAAAGRPDTLAFSPDGRRLAAGVLVEAGHDWFERVTVWDLTVGRPVATLRSRALPMSQEPRRRQRGARMEFSPDGRFLVFRSVGHGLFWDLAADPPRCLAELLEPDSRFVSFGQDASRYPLFSPDGAHFVVPGRVEGALAIHNAHTCAPQAVLKVGIDGLQLSQFPMPTGGASGVNGPSLPQSVLSPDGRWLLVANRESSPQPSRLEASLARLVGRAFLWSDGRPQVRLFDMTTGAEAGRFSTNGSVLGFAADSRSFWTYAQTSSTKMLEVRQWPVPTGWPPMWLLAVTALGLMVVITNWRRSRRRPALPAAAAVGYPAEQGGAS